jgi:hypothetical protein
VIRGKPLGAEEEFKAPLFRAVREQLHVHKLGVPPEVGVSSYLVPGALVPVSAIYDNFHEPGCSSKPTRGSALAGDSFDLAAAADSECGTVLPQPSQALRLRGKRRSRFALEWRLLSSSLFLIAVSLCP